MTFIHSLFPPCVCRENAFLTSDLTALWLKWNVCYVKLMSLQLKSFHKVTFKSVHRIWHSRKKMCVSSGSIHYYWSERWLNVKHLFSYTYPQPCLLQHNATEKQTLSVENYLIALMLSTVMSPASLHTVMAPCLQHLA